ncbi:hypothetical protein BWQ96_10156 [Gracilariopsis chorda]|uniref:Uncharacterized protein n=1 Tax=Gracilariopsis chorda TaxID=448386 RepID=A0A2V3IG40_9FLOR|nr:hypothetical protein BWQ96_10156 [Gracilariopsis chorda]|eukprot:PXF40140.1 hypothetical protein BWQ96_10156 [Gracilariopsis chorda]
MSGYKRTSLDGSADNCSEPRTPTNNSPPSSLPESPAMSRNSNTPSAPPSSTARMQVSNPPFRTAPLPQSAPFHPGLGRPRTSSSGRAPAWDWRQAPWFDPEAVRDTELVDSFAVDGYLPGGLPVAVTNSWDWRTRIAVSPSCLFVPRNETRQYARSELARIGYARHFRAPNEHPVPVQYRFDVAFYRTFGEVGYGDRLANVLDELDRFADVVQPYQDLILWARPILRAEFRYLRRPSRSTYLEGLRFERKWRSRFGIMAPYQCSEVERLAGHARRGRYLSIPDFWPAVEVPRGCYVELPPCLTYVGSYFINNPPEGLWSLLATEWTVRVAAYLLIEAYDAYRLWHIPELVRQSIRHLDQSEVLGSVRNAREATQMVDLIDQIDWDRVPANQVSDGVRRPTDRSPGRDTNAGDFVYFDPWKWEVISAAEAGERRREDRYIPAGHPRGFIFIDDDGEDPAEGGSPKDEGSPAGESEEPAVSGGGEAIEAVDHPAEAAASSSEPWGQSATDQASQPVEMTPRAAALRDFLRGVGLTVPDAVTDESDLQALGAQYYAGKNTTSGGGPSA